MFEFGQFVVVSTIEYVSVLMAMLALFRFELRRNLHLIIGISLFISIVSHALHIQYGGMASYAPIIQLLLFIIAIRYLFSVRFLNVLFMMGYAVVYILLQAILIAFIVSLGIVSDDVLQSALSKQMYLIQLITAMINFLVAWYCSRKNIGFTFIPTLDHFPIHWGKTNRWLTWGIAAGLVLSFLAYVIFRQHINFVFWGICLLFIAVVIFMTMVTIRKEFEDD